MREKAGGRRVAKDAPTRRRKPLRARAGTPKKGARSLPTRFMSRTPEPTDRVLSKKGGAACGTGKRGARKKEWRGVLRREVNSKEKDETQRDEIGRGRGEGTHKKSD
ncbi:hypothetical protein TRVL_03835 [Trypanosoma vivax]|nr:hypothetical protein TRVL_03835 [Trypanosoma vivax]